MRKLFMLAATALTVGGLFLMGGSFAASGFSLSKFNTEKVEQNRYTVSEAFQNIEIHSDEARITFELIEHPEESGLTAEINCTEREKTKHHVSVEDNTLKITLKDERKWYERVSFGITPQITMTVGLTQEQFDALKIDSDTGDVTIPDSFRFGSAEISEDTGSVDYSADVSGALHIKTDTGRIQLRDLSAQQIDLRVSTGKITVESVRCEDAVSVNVSTGRTELTDLSCGSLISGGSTGKLTMKNVTASGDMQIERSTGDVRFESCDAENITVKTSTGDVTGTLRSGKIFSAGTSTGSVHVPDSTAGGKCELRTNTGDIEIQLES